jgi:hypothetical protein
MNVVRVSWQKGAELVNADSEPQNRPNGMEVRTYN